VSLFTDKKNSEKYLEEGLEKLALDNTTLVQQFKTHFDSISLSSAQKQALEASLLSHPKPNSPLIAHFLAFHKKIILSHVMTAAAAIAVTLGLATYLHSPNETTTHDLISEVVGLSENLNFPADFNLDGNLNDLPDLINDSLPNHSFTPAIPAQIAQNYSAYEGRFFLFKGEQGVGISVLPSLHEDASIPLRLQQGFEHRRHSTLYIVKLSDRNRSSFPTQRTSRKISSASGKIRHVYAWRDGTYGYAMVQPLDLE